MPQEWTRERERERLQLGAAVVLTGVQQERWEEKKREKRERRAGVTQALFTPGDPLWLSMEVLQWEGFTPGQHGTLGDGVSVSSLSLPGFQENM